MKPTDVITFRGKEYPVYDITIFVEGESQEVRVGNMELSSALIPDPECPDPYQDKEAERIDESIFYFITGEEEKLSEPELVKFIEEQIQ